MTPTLTERAIRLFTADGVVAAGATLTDFAKTSGASTIVTVAESKRDGSSVLVAVTVTVEGDGTAAGAVYSPAAEIVPRVALPPTMSFTLQVTAGATVPLDVAVNCFVAVVDSTALEGLIVIALNTVNGSGEVAVPSGVVTVIGPVNAPSGTDVVMLFAVAALTVAIVPLKETVFCAGSGPKPLPKIETSVPTFPLSR